MSEKIRINLTISTIIFLYLISTCFPQTQTEMDNLYTHILTNYKKSIRPSENHTHPTDITVLVEIYKIVETDMPLGIFSAVITIHSSWRDTRLSWNSSDYGGATSVVLEKSDVWCPRFSIGPPVDQLDPFGDSSARIRITDTGEASVSDVDLAKVSCKYNQEKYPFDSQVCELIIFQQGYLADNIKYVLPSTRFVMLNYIPHQEWNLVKTQLLELSIPNYLALVGEIKINRRERYFMLINFVPVTLLTILNSLIFKIPIESGERVGYSITCLLALAVYLTEITNTLPSGSNNMSYVSYYLTVMIINSSLSCCVAIFSMCMYFYDDQETVPRCVQKMVYSLSWPPFCFKRCRRKTLPKNKISTVAPAEKTNETITIGKVNIAPIDGGKWLTIGWKDVSRTIDNIMFVGGLCFILFSIVLTLVGLTV